MGDADFLNHVGQISIETHATRTCINTLCNSHCLKMQDSSSSGAVCSDVAGTSTMAVCQKYRERWACRVETDREARRTLSLLDGAVTTGFGRELLRRNCLQCSHNRFRT